MGNTGVGGMVNNYCWTYNYAEGGADVWRGHGERRWVARVANGVVAQAMCNWLDVYTAGPLDLTINPPRS